MSYLHQYPAASQQTILAVDFGGGTLDLCLLKRFEEGFKVIGTHGIGLGGDHIDQLMFKNALSSSGQGRTLAAGRLRPGNRNALPLRRLRGAAAELGGVLHAQSESLHHAADAAYRRRRRSVVKFRRLYDLIKNNYSYLVFQALKDLKAELSSHDTARLDIPEIDIDLTVSREHFEDIILPVLTELQAAIVTILQRANIKAEQIQLVLRTGVPH